MNKNLCFLQFWPKSNILRSMSAILEGLRYVAYLENTVCVSVRMAGNIICKQIALYNPATLTIGELLGVSGKLNIISNDVEYFFYEINVL